MDNKYRKYIQFKIAIAIGMEWYGLVCNNNDNKCYIGQWVCNVRFFTTNWPVLGPGYLPVV